MHKIVCMMSLFSSALTVPPPLSPPSQSADPSSMSVCHRGERHPMKNHEGEIRITIYVISSLFVPCILSWQDNKEQQWNYKRKCITKMRKSFAHSRKKNISAKVWWGPFIALRSLCEACTQTTDTSISSLRSETWAKLAPSIGPRHGGMKTVR